MKTFISTAMVVVCVAASVIAWRGRCAAESARAASDSLAAQRSKLLADIAAIEARMGQSHQAEATLVSQRAEVEAKLARRAGQPAQNRAEGTALPQPGTAAGLESHPGLRSLFQRSLHADLALRYHALYVTAGLSPEQIRQFEALMTEAEEVKLDLRVAAGYQGIEVSDPSLEKLRAEGAVALQSALRDLLGDGGYQQLQQFRRAEPLDVVINDAAKLIAPQAPLSAGQRDQLQHTLANASARYQAGGAADVQTVDWPRALTEARAFLSPAQFAVLQQEANLQEVYAMARRFYAQQGTGAPQ